MVLSIRKLLAMLLSLGLLAGLALPLAANADTNKLVIVTSYPHELTTVFKKAFTEKYPDIDVEVLNKNTNAAVNYIESTTGNNRTDLMWASSPDAFEVLKLHKLLEKYHPHVSGIPKTIGSYPIDDPDGYYSGFALSGYGIMWNTRYLQIKHIPAPQEWSDLTKPVYYGTVGITSPSRSGTAHLTVETILQGKGWTDGWKLVKDICGNLSEVTQRSFGVPEGVNSGQFGVGIVIDFFALSSEANGYPVKFVYPKVTTLVPANIGVIKNAPNAGNAHKFIDFLISKQGQALLFDPHVRRLPVNPDAYENAPEGYPNPFEDKSLGRGVDFDVDLSGHRYNVINALFDVMVTYRLNELKAATGAIHKASKALAEHPNAEAQKLVDQARALIAKMPITAEQASDPDFVSVFTTVRKKASDKSSGRQAQIEQKWDKFTVDNYNEAKALANKALSML